MSEVKTSKTKRSKFKNLKSEFKKIVWPNKSTLVKETTVVIVVSVLLGIIISVVDFIVKYGMDFLVQ